MDAIEGYASRDAGPTDTRLINMNAVTGWGYVVRGDSDIQTIHDIGPGTRIAYSPSSSFLLAGIDALLAYLDLDPDEVNLVEVGNFAANTQVLAEGRVDVTFTSPTSGPSYEAEAGPHSIRWLPLPREEEDPEAFARYRAIHTGYVAREVETGVSTSHGLYMDHAFQANHVSADEDPEFVYQLLKWMDEAHDSYKDDFTHAHMMSIDNLVAFLDNGALQPLHEGAIRYLDAWVNGIDGVRVTTPDGMPSEWVMVKQLPSLAKPIPAARAAQATYSWPLRITCAPNGGWPDILIVTWPQTGSMMWNE
jgi:TRAP-type uncharacterized transport system substrate-binding protein